MQTVDLENNKKGESAKPADALDLGSYKEPIQLIVN